MLRLFRPFYWERQIRPKDCGIACIRIILNQLQLPAPSPQTLRKLARTTNEGTLLRGLYDALDVLGLQVQTLDIGRAAADSSSRSTMSDNGLQYELLRQIAVPAIAVTTTDSGIEHFVVIHQVGRRSLLIADPALGIRKWSRSSFCRRSCGIVLTVRPSPRRTLTPAGDPIPSPRRFLLRLLAIHRSFVGTIWLAALFHSGLSVAGTAVFRCLIDVLNNASKESVFLLAAGIVLVQLARNLFESFYRYLRATLGRRVVGFLRRAVADKLQRLSGSSISSQSATELMGPFRSDAPTIGAACLTVTDVLWDAVHVAVLFSALSYVAPHVSIGVAGLLAVAAIVALLIHLRLQRAKLEASSHTGEAMEYIADGILGFHLTKLHDRGEDRLYETDWLLQRGDHSQACVDGLRVLSNAGTHLIGTVAIALAFWGCAMAVIAGEMSIGALILVWILLLQLRGHVNRLASSLSPLQTGVLSATRLLDLLNEDVEDAANPNAVTVSDGPVAVQLHDVSVRRQDNAHDVLSELSMTLEPGSLSVLVSKEPSKTNAIRELLTGDVQPYAGRILLNGVDMRDLNVGSWRRHLTLLSPNPFLFQDSVYNNIALANEAATSAEVHAALRNAGLEETVSSFPNRMETRIGRHGTPMSAQQSRLFEVARAIVKRPLMVLVPEIYLRDARCGPIVRRLLVNEWRDASRVILTERENIVEEADHVVGLDSPLQSSPAVEIAYPDPCQCNQKENVHASL